MAWIAEDQGPRLQLRETSTSPAAPLRSLHEKKNPEPPPRPHLSRLVSSRRPRGGGDTRQARRRRAEPGTPSHDPAGRRASVAGRRFAGRRFAGRRFAGRRPAPRPTLLPCAAVLRSFQRTATAAAPRRLAPRPPGSRRPALPASLCGSLLLPGWWLAPSPNSQRYAKLFPPKFLTLTSEIGDELVD